MQSRIFKKIITAFLVLFLVFSPILGIEKAEAQVSGSYKTTGSYGYGSGGTSGGLNGYIKGLGPAITQLPKCKKKIKGAIKTLFGKNKGVVAKEASSKLGDGTSLGGRIDDAQNAADAIHNYDEEANKKLETQDATLKRIDEATGSLDENSSCLDSIGKLIIDRMIQRITLATVEWIRTGNNGGPAFVQDPGKFWRDIAKEEILTFGLQLNIGADCKGVISGDVISGVTTNTTNINSTSDCVSPYAKAWFKSQAKAFNKKFTDNARYSLNELIAETTPQYTGVKFKADFSAGGWNAWTALTSVPANNPVGFGLLAESELSKRLAGTQKSTAEQVQDALKEANGFLGDLRCADPEGMTKDQHKAALDSGQPGCLRFEYVTPGKVVAEEALKISHFQENKLLRADTLNDAMAAIVDALIQRFSNELYEEGLASFSDEGSDGGLILNAYGVDGSYTINQIEKDFPEYLQGSDWFAAHLDFNIRTDLTQAIIDEQRTFIEKLQKQSEVLERVIQDTLLLDYCIPGPSPKKYQAIGDINLFEGQEEVELKFDLAELVLQFDPTGIFSGIGSAILEKQHERDIKKIIATHLGLMFGIHIYGAFGYSAHEDDPKINQDQVLNKDDMEGLGRNILTSYRELIHNTYFNGSKSLAPMPLVTNEARNEYARIDAYKEIIEQNDDRIGLMKSVVQRLGRIKEIIEDLGPVPGPSDPGFADYEESLKTKKVIAEFGRLTGEMVTGDDVARMHKMLQEIEDKESYVKDDLLLGPGGCEEEMITLYDEDKATYSKFYRRQPYGEPIPYLYGKEVGDKTTEVADPHFRTLWSEEAVKYWNPNEGFMYGSVYWNFWARPYDGGDPYSGDNKTPNPPNLGKIQKALEASCPEFIDVVYFSYPGGKGFHPADIGGLEPVGGGEIIPYGDNKCGVVTEKLEEMVGIY